jgi:hypothetical protein
MNVRATSSRFLSPKLTFEPCYEMIVLRDAQEQRAARLEAERKLAEFQEQLKKVFYRQHDPGGLAFTSCR